MSSRITRGLPFGVEPRLGWGKHFLGANTYPNSAIGSIIGLTKSLNDLQAPRSTVEVQIQVQIQVQMPPLLNELCTARRRLLPNITFRIQKVDTSTSDCLFLISKPNCNMGEKTRRRDDEHTLFLHHGRWQRKAPAHVRIPQSARLLPCFPVFSLILTFMGLVRLRDYVGYLHGPTHDPAQDDFLFDWSKASILPFAS